MSALRSSTRVCAHSGRKLPPCLQDAEQIFQAPLAAVGGPQRIALEVEEQVTRVGVGQQRQRLRVDDLVLRGAAIALQHLEFGLRGQLAQRAGRQVGHRAGVAGQLGNRA